MDTPKKFQTSQDKPDYYFNEQGLFVFTATYLKRRGYCCQNGCKNCPYGFKKQEKP